MDISPLEYFLMTQKDDVICEILNQFDVDILLQLMSLSRLMHGICKLYILRTWNIEDFIRGWFPRVYDVQSMLHRSGAVISGSQVLHFLQRQNFTSDSLDIYVRVGGASIVVHFLRICGYGFYRGDQPPLLNGNWHGEAIVSEVNGPTALSGGFGGDSVSGVFTYAKCIGWGRPRWLRVRMMVVRLDPVQHIVFEFGTTGSRNFITSRDVVCLFPRSTLVDKISYITKGPDPQAMIMTGLHTVGADDVGQVKNPFFGKRFVGDRFSWKFEVFEKVLYSPSVYGERDESVAFETLPYVSGVVAVGAFLCIGKPFLWRMMLEPRSS